MTSATSRSALPGDEDAFLPPCSRPPSPFDDGPPTSKADDAVETAPDVGDAVKGSSTCRAGIVDDARLERFLSDLADYRVPSSPSPPSSPLAPSLRTRSLTYSPTSAVELATPAPARESPRAIERHSLDGNRPHDVTDAEELVLTPSAEALFGSVGARTLAGQRLPPSP